MPHFRYSRLEKRDKRCPITKTPSRMCPAHPPAWHLIPQDSTLTRRSFLSPIVRIKRKETKRNAPNPIQKKCSRGVRTPLERTLNPQTPFNHTDHQNSNSCLRRTLLWQTGMWQTGMWQTCMSQKRAPFRHLSQFSTQPLIKLRMVLSNMSVDLPAKLKKRLGFKSLKRDPRVLWNAKLDSNNSVRSHMVSHLPRLTQYPFKCVFTLIQKNFYSLSYVTINYNHFDVNIWTIFHVSVRDRLHFPPGNYSPKLAATFSCV